MAFYSVCSHLIESDKMPRHYLPFMLVDSTVPGKPDLLIRYSSEPIKIGQAKQIANLSFMSIWKEQLEENGYRWIFKPNNGTGSIAVSHDYSKVVIHYHPFCGRLFSENLAEIFGSCIQIIVECKLIHDGFLILHSACVEKDGFAYAFTGPSGIGKSTRAQKWCELFSAELVSGDRPAINVEKNNVYGVPWDGKEGIYRNVHFPLAAVFIIKRSESVNVTELTESEKIQALSQQISIPMWDPMLAAKALHSLKALIRQNLIYEVRGGIDNQAILQSYETLCKTIFKKEEAENENGIKL